jgi:uncharacterized membrane protein
MRPRPHLLSDGPVVVVTLVFVVSRLLYRVASGVRLDVSPVHYFIQYVDLWFVEHDFVRSILYLHHQAPLQNVVVGGILRLLGTRAGYVLLDALYVGLGFVLGLALLSALRRLGVSPFLATLATSLYIALPGIVLFESWLFYPLPTAVLLALALVALLRYYERGDFTSGLLFFGLLAAVALLRSTFGTVYVGAVAATLWLRPPPAPAGTSARSTLVKAALVPGALIWLWAAKTSLLVGAGYGDALLWQNLVTKICGQIPQSDLERLISEGHLSEAARIRPPLVDLARYGRLRISAPPTGVPLLDLSYAPSGRLNAHAIEYVRIALKYDKPDALYLLRHRPQAYLRAVFIALGGYFETPASNDLVRLTRNFDRLQSLYRGSETHWETVALLALLPLAAAYGAYRMTRGLVSGTDPRTTAAFAYMFITIAYVTLVTTLVSYGDFSRYRYDIDPLYLILGIVMTQDVCNRGARWWRRRGHPLQEPTGI